MVKQARARGSVAARNSESGKSESGESEMKHILILISDYGYGHRSAANAIAEALRQSYGRDCTVEIVNPLNEPDVPAFLPENQAQYDNLVRERPELYAAGYKVGDQPMTGDLIEAGWMLMLFNVLRDIVR